MTAVLTASLYAAVGTSGLVRHTLSAVPINTCILTDFVLHPNSQAVTSYKNLIFAPGVAGFASVDGNFRVGFNDFSCF